jgi:hypothetical protein
MFATERTARPGGGGTAILVCRGIDHYAVPVAGLQHLEASAIHLVLATRPVKLAAAYLSPTRPLIESDLSECLSGVFPILLAGDLSAKHADWSSRLTTARGSLLRDYFIRNTCLIYGPDSPITAPYTHNATPDVLDIVVVKDFVQPVYLFALHSARITYFSRSTPRADHPFKHYWTGLHPRLALMTDSRGIPW